ncbi:hypothetical protein L7F22_022751 [Adiantum nelumboides]|nr:hypothetical protein [Adiantum nelumboides]
MYLDLWIYCWCKSTSCHAHTQRCGKLLPGGSHTFWEPAVGDHLSSGGVCISVGSRWLPRVIDHGTLVAGRAVWISLQYDASVVGILCIYAPTTAAERSWFWDQIVHVLPPVDSWIVGGDFNNVETFEDWRAAQPPTLPHIARCERDAWDFVYAAELVEENGRFTGQLKGMASSNAEKADRVREYAKKYGVSLADSLAFGDSVADLPMLEIVGHPHAVNPDARLQVLAEKRGWPVINWGLKPTLISAIAA